MQGPADVARAALTEALERAGAALETEPSAEACTALAETLLARAHTARHTLGAHVADDEARAVALSDALHLRALSLALELGRRARQETPSDLAQRQLDAADAIAAQRTHVKDMARLEEASSVEAALIAIAREHVLGLVETALGRAPDARATRLSRQLAEVGNATEWRGATTADVVEHVWRMLLRLEEHVEGPVGARVAWSTERLCTWLEGQHRSGEAQALRAAYVARAEEGFGAGSVDTLRMRARWLLGLAKAKADDLNALANQLQALLHRIERAGEAARRDLSLERTELRAAIAELAKAGGDTNAHERRLQADIDAARRDRGRESTAYAWAVRAFGQWLCAAGRLDEAERALRTARKVFESPRLRDDDDDVPSASWLDLDFLDLALARAAHRDAEALFRALDAKRQPFEVLAEEVLSPRRAKLAALLAQLPPEAPAVASAEPPVIRMRQPKLGLVGVVVSREGNKVRLRLEDGTERVFLEDRLERVD